MTTNIVKIQTIIGLSIIVDFEVKLSLDLIRRDSELMEGEVVGLDLWSITEAFFLFVLPIIPKIIAPTMANIGIPKNAPYPTIKSIAPSNVKKK